MSSGVSVRQGSFKRASAVVVAAALFGLVALSSAPFCPTAGLFGIPCPGCGLTRAALAALRGDFGGAFHLHPLVFLLAPLYLAALAAAALAFVRSPEPARAVAPRPPARPWVTTLPVTLGAALLMVALLGVWGLRFFGWFGGPAPVTTWAEWAAQ